MAAYHGVKQRSAKLDEAILAKPRGGKDPTFTAWAVRGFWDFRKSVPAELVQAGLTSEEPRARAAAAQAVASQGGKDAAGPLLPLLADRDEQVRAAAARSLGGLDLGKDRDRVIGAMVSALDLPGEHARQVICEALGRLTGRPMPYDPKADEAKRTQAIQAWKEWAKSRQGAP